MPAKPVTKPAKSAAVKPVRKPTVESAPLRPAQVRMARAGLDWSAEELAQAAGLNRNMIAGFERGIYDGEPALLARMRATLESAGVEFIDGEAPGVRLNNGRKR